MVSPPWSDFLLSACGAGVPLVPLPLPLVFAFAMWTSASRFAGLRRWHNCIKREGRWHSGRFGLAVVGCGREDDTSVIARPARSETGDAQEACVLEELISAV